MKMGFAILILLTLCIGVLGLFYIATHAQPTANIDSYNRTDSVNTNLTRGNVTAAMPVGFTILSIAAIIVGLLIVVIAIAVVANSSKHTRISYR